MLRKQRGITLVELITVVVVIGILAAIAIPSYRSYLIRTQRTEAKTALLNLRAAQEKFYLQNNSYAATVDALNFPSASETGLYDIEVVPGAGNQSYTAFAAPRNGRSQEEDTKCLTLSLSDVGRKGASGPGGTDYCWR